MGMEPPRLAGMEPPRLAGVVGTLLSGTLARAGGSAGAAGALLAGGGAAGPDGWLRFDLTYSAPCSFDHTPVATLLLENHSARFLPFDLCFLVGSMSWYVFFCLEFRVRRRIIL